MKDKEEDWECAFNNFVQTATQHDRDVIVEVNIIMEEEVWLLTKKMKRKQSL
jgi:hypothetical protein